MAFVLVKPSDDEISVIRTLIPDSEAVFGPNEDQTMFTDDEIGNFFAAGNGNVLRAAGFANYSIATSEALISKVIKTQDLSTNGAAVAQQLLAKGKELFARADKDDDNSTQDFFEIIDYREGWTTYPAELTEYGF